MPSSAGLHSLAADRRPPWRVVLVLAWPVLVQQFLVLSVGLYDQFLAGNNSPDDRAKHISYQAAQTTANYIAWSIYSLSALVAVGGTALVARFVGAGDRASAVRTTNQCVLLAIFFGAAFTPIILAVLPWGSRLLNPDPEAAESAVRFLQPIVWGMTCQFVAQAGIACLGCAMVLAVLARGRYGLKLELSRFRPDVSLIGRLLRISVPASVDSFSMCACQLWFLSLVTALGDVAAAAHGTAIRVEGLGYMTGQAFMIAASALVGQNLGARRPHEAAHAAWVALGLGCLGMSLMGVFFFAFAPELFHLFSPHEHQQPIVEAGVPVLRLVAFAMPPLSAIIVLTGALRGAGDTRFPILLTWIGFLVIRLPLAYLLTRAVVDLGPLGQVRGWDLGLMGAWYAMFADLAIRGVLFLGRFVGGKWKTVKV
jgi:Na+-driven multidrug efflux pump